VIFVDEKDTQKQHAVLGKKKWHLQEKKLRTEVISGKSKKLKKLKPLLHLLQHLNKMILLVMKMRMTRTKSILRKDLWPLGNHLKKTRKARKINANIVIMVLAILNKTIKCLLN
jgi:hypothetical protein